MIRDGQTVRVTRKDSVFHGRTGTVKRISFLSGEPRYLISFAGSPFVYGFRKCHLAIV